MSLPVLIFIAYFKFMAILVFFLADLLIFHKNSVTIYFLTLSWTKSCIYISRKKCMFYSSSKCLYFSAIKVHHIQGVPIKLSKINYHKLSFEIITQILKIARFDYNKSVF